MNNTYNKAVRIGFTVVSISDSALAVKPVITPLQLTACYLKSSKTCAGWLCFDLMDIDKASVDYLKNALAAEMHFAKENIHILSTHNHGGGEIEDYDIDALAKMAVASVLEAEKNAKPAYVSYGESCINEQLNYIRRFCSKELQGKTTFFWGPCPENNYDCSNYLSCNIQNIKEGEASYSGQLSTDTPRCKLPSGDNRLQILFFEEKDGTPIGSICRFAAHAICCNSPDYYSSDYPYYVRKTIEDELGGTAVFMNGPCAEIAPGILNKHSGMEEKLGAKIGKEAVRLIKCAKREKVNFIADSSKEIALPLRKEMLEFNAQDEILKLNKILKNKDSIALPELKKLTERKRFLETLSFLKQKATGGREQVVTLGKLVINNITIMALPGEIFSSTTENAIKRKNGEKIITVTEHDCTAMYIVPEDEYCSGGYETTCCMVSKNAEQILVKAIKNFKK